MRYARMILTAPLREALGRSRTPGLVMEGTAILAVME